MNPKTTQKKKSEILHLIKNSCAKLKEFDYLSETSQTKLKSLLPLLIKLPEEILPLEYSQDVFSLVEKFIIRSTKLKAKGDYEFAQKVSFDISAKFDHLPKNSKWQQEDIERLYTELKSYIQQKNIVVLPLYIPILENLPQICSSEDHVKFKPLLNKLIDEFKKSSKTQNPLYKET